MKFQWRKETPIFQQGGPYEALAKRHRHIELDIGKLYLGVAVPSILYLITKSSVFIIIAALYFAAIAGYKLLKERELFTEYTDMQKKTWQKLQTAVEEKAGGAPAEISFGYKKTEDAFDPVFLLKTEGKLTVYPNVFIKNCTYGADSNMLYILDLKESPFETPLAEYDLAHITWSEEKLTHQDMLRSEGIRLNRYLVIENAIYDQILDEMKRNKRKQILNMKVVMMDIRKEKMFRLTPEGNQFSLLLPQSAGSKLELF